MESVVLEQTDEYIVFYGKDEETGDYKRETFSSFDSPVKPKDMPTARGVQLILQRDDRVQTLIATGSDYYIRVDGKWWGVDIFGLFDYLIESGLVLFGRSINSAEYQEILRQAKVEKAAWLSKKPVERKPFKTDTEERWNLES